jgi:hypothetical protein
MMQLGRRATLLVVLSLLISAATAYAECAWVLWVAGPGRRWKNESLRISVRSCLIDGAPDVGYPLPHSLRRREGGSPCAQLPASSSSPY